MDHEDFDRLIRSLGTTGTRRTMLGALLGVGLLGADPAQAKRQRGGKSRRLRAQAAALRTCVNPGPGQNLSRCNFFDDDLRGANLRSANLSGAFLAGAELCGADLRSANLSKTDFRHANLTRADLRGTNLSTARLGYATFCETRMPNGTLNNTGCPPSGTAICCQQSECGSSCSRGVCDVIIGCQSCSSDESYYKSRFDSCLAGGSSCAYCASWMGCDGDIATGTSCGTVDGDACEA